MGIEENVARIADALESIAALMETANTLHLRVAEVAEANRRDYFAPKAVAPAEAVSPEAGTPKPDPAPAVLARPEPAQDYDALKRALQARGVEIPKGTKMTTLLKLWEAHKSDPVGGPAPAEPAPEAPQTDAAPAETPEPAAAPAEPAEDIFEEPAAPAPAPKKPMTAAEARRAIMEGGYTGTPEQIEKMKAVLQKLGKSRFTELVEGEFEAFIEACKQQGIA